MTTLYTTPLSANGRKVLAVSHELGLEPEIELVNVYRGEGQTRAYRAVNPFGKIPTLVDGDLVLWESNAILVYLAEAHGGFRLWSRDAARRADIARWLFWETSSWQPALAALLAPCVGALLRPEDGAGAPPAPDWTRPGAADALRFLDSHLRERAFLTGEEPTLADFSVAGMAMYLPRAGFPLASFPHLGAWYARIEAIPSWRSTAAGPWRSPTEE